jgi:hypothetical protein
MEKRYVWYLCLVLWLPDDALMKVVLFGFMMPGRACLRCSQMTGRVIMLLEFPGVNEQGRIQTPWSDEVFEKSTRGPRTLHGTIAYHDNEHASFICMKSSSF